MVLFVFFIRNLVENCDFVRNLFVHVFVRHFPIELLTQATQTLDWPTGGYAKAYWTRATPIHALGTWVLMSAPRRLRGATSSRCLNTAVNSDGLHYLDVAIMLSC